MQIQFVGARFINSPAPAVARTFSPVAFTVGDKQWDPKQWEATCYQARIDRLGRRTANQANARRIEARISATSTDGGGRPATGPTTPLEAERRLHRLTARSVAREENDLGGLGADEAQQRLATLNAKS